MRNATKATRKDMRMTKEVAEMFTRLCTIALDGYSKDEISLLTDFSSINKYILPHNYFFNKNKEKKICQISPSTDICRAISEIAKNGVSYDELILAAKGKAFSIRNYNYYNSYNLDKAISLVNKEIKRKNFTISDISNKYDISRRSLNSFLNGEKKTINIRLLRELMSLFDTKEEKELFASYMGYPTATNTILDVDFSLLDKIEYEEAREQLVLHNCSLKTVINVDEYVDLIKETLMKYSYNQISEKYEISFKCYNKLLDINKNNLSQNHLSIVKNILKSLKDDELLFKYNCIKSQDMIQEMIMQGKKDWCLYLKKNVFLYDTRRTVASKTKISIPTLEKIYFSVTEATIDRIAKNYHLDKKEMMILAEKNNVLKTRKVENKIGFRKLRYTEVVERRA